MLHTISNQTKFQYKFSPESDMGGVQESTLDKLARLNDEIAANRFQATLKAEGLPSDMKLWQYNDYRADQEFAKTLESENLPANTTRAEYNDMSSEEDFQATLKAEGLPSDMKLWQYNDLTAQKRRLKEKGLTSN